MKCEYCRGVASKKSRENGKCENCGAPLREEEGRLISPFEENCRQQELAFLGAYAQSPYRGMGK